MNLGGVDYISSPGLRVLLTSLKCLKPCVKEVFDISGFTQPFETYEGDADAVDSF